MWKCHEMNNIFITKALAINTFHSNILVIIIAVSQQKVFTGTPQNNNMQAKFQLENRYTKFS